MALDETQLLRVKDWARMVEDRLAETVLNQVELAKSAGVARSTLLSWLNAQAAPDPWAVRKIGTAIALPVLDQFAVLGWWTRDDQDDLSAVGLNEGLRRAQVVRLSRVLEQVEQAVAALNEAPSMVCNVSRSAVELASVIAGEGGGRWEARMFPMATGVQYPLPQQTGIEFRPVDSAAAMSRDELNVRFGDYIKARAPKLYNEPDPSNTRTEQIACERLELRALIDQYPRAAGIDGTWIGEGGRRWNAVSKFTTESRDWTHMFIATEPGFPASDAAVSLVDAKFATLLVIAKGFDISKHVSSLVAEALGWSYVSLGAVTSAHWGGRGILGIGGDRIVQLRTTFDHLLDLPPKRTVIAIDRPAMFDEDTCARLSASGVMTVVIEPNDEAMNAWELQQRDNTAFKRPAGDPHNENTVAGVRSAYTHLRDLIDSGVPHVGFVPFAPESIAPPSAEIFSDPRLGDTSVRVAEAVRRRLDVSPLDSTRLERFAEILATDNHVPAWT